jgi:pyruvate ferredoxin oxidoreductase alpha subunit
LIENYNLQGAEQAIIALGSQCSTIKYVINELKNKGKKIGLIKIKSFRPFPEKELQAVCKHLKRIDVIDRAISLGNSAPLYTEVKASLCNGIKINSHVLGLGGRDIAPEMIKGIIK